MQRGGGRCADSSYMDLISGQTDGEGTYTDLRPIQAGTTVIANVQDHITGVTASYVNQRVVDKTARIKDRTRHKQESESKYQLVSYFKIVHH